MTIYSQYPETDFKDWDKETQAEYIIEFGRYIRSEMHVVYTLPNGYVAKVYLDLKTDAILDIRIEE